jgi:hypothetical protein
MQKRRKKKEKKEQDGRSPLLGREDVHELVDLAPVLPGHEGQEELGEVERGVGDAVRQEGKEQVQLVPAEVPHVGQRVVEGLELRAQGRPLRRLGLHLHLHVITAAVLHLDCLLRPFVYLQSFKWQTSFQLRCFRVARLIHTARLRLYKRAHFKLVYSQLIALFNFLRIPRCFFHVSSSAGFPLNSGTIHFQYVCNTKALDCAQVKTYNQHFYYNQLFSLNLSSYGLY